MEPESSGGASAAQRTRQCGS